MKKLSLAGIVSMGCVAAAVGLGCASPPAGDLDVRTSTSAVTTNLQGLGELADEIAQLDDEAKAAWRAWKAAWDEYNTLLRPRTVGQCARANELQGQISSALRTLQAKVPQREAALVRFNAMSRTLSAAGTVTREGAMKVSIRLFGRLFSRAIVGVGTVTMMNELIELKERVREAEALAACHDPSMNSANRIPADLSCFEAATRLVSVVDTIVTLYGEKPSACTAQGRAHLDLLRWEATQLHNKVENCDAALKYYEDTPGFDDESQLFDQTFTCGGLPDVDPNAGGGEPSGGDGTPGDDEDSY